MEVRVKAVILLQFLRNVRNVLDERKLVDGLRVVGDRAVGINRDRYRPHAKESKCNETKSKDGGRNHQRAEAKVGDEIAHAHEQNHGKAEVVTGEIAGDEAGQNAERSAALFRRVTTS